jgi:alpha-tubulin suppressor-like RCC1 family protein
MASTRKGVWDLQGVRDKYLQSLWANPNTLFVWGVGGKGALGQNSLNAVSSPIQLSGDWSVVAANDNSAAGVRGDGTLWTWGRGDSGNLGHNQPADTNYSSPKQVGTNSDWSYVQAGNESIGAITSSGEMYTWGQNAQYRLGLSDETKRSSPTQLPGTGWSEISVGGNFLLFRKSNGTLWSTGANNDGQLGQNNETAYSSPKQIGTQTHWTAMTAGTKGAFGLTNPGALYGWGETVDGNLGFNQSSGKFSSPKQVPGSWKSISMNQSSAWGVKTDGTLWGWGNNTGGHLGHNNRTQYSSPRQVGTDTTWELVDGPGAISVANDPCVMAVKTDGTLWTWGYADDGGLGLNQFNPTYRSSPTQVGTSTKWTTNKDELSCGKWYMFATEKGLTPSQL